MATAAKNENAPQPGFPGLLDRLEMVTDRNADEDTRASDAASLLHILACAMAQSFGPAAKAAAELVTIMEAEGMVSYDAGRDAPTVQELSGLFDA